MNRLIALILILGLPGLYASEREVVQQVRVFDTTPAAFETLDRLGVPLDHVTVKQGVYVEITCSPAQTREIRQAGLPVLILIPDLEQYYRSRAAGVVPPERDFDLGSLLGNYTLDEALARMDSLVNTWPAFVSPPESIGVSLEGRAIWAFKVSDNPLLDEPEPEVLYTGLTHAREPIGMMNLFYFVYFLLENYGEDSLATYLVNEREMWFLPVVNPDGYVYNQSIAPAGGGMHRKNRRDTGCGDGYSRGVDLNRNYSYAWGQPGASGNPCEATFRGDSAFSEPETRVVRDFVLAHDFADVLHYHSYSNVLIHSYGDGSLPAEPDLTTLREIGLEMTRVNGFPVGTGTELIGYGVSGDAVDWTYGAQGLIAYTPEVGRSSDGFWPLPTRVLPLCREQLYANQIFALVAGSDFKVYTIALDNEYPAAGDSLLVSLTIQNRGLADSDGPVSVVLVPLDNYTVLSQTTHQIPSLAARTTALWDVPVLIPADIPGAQETGFEVRLRDAGSFLHRDTVRFIVGQPVTVFFDGAETGLGHWQAANGWGLTGTAWSGGQAFTDSPSGNYPDNWTSTLRLLDPLDFRYVAFPRLTFRARWDIETGWDFVRVQASTDGSNWTSLPGRFTRIGGGQGTQIQGEPGYDGWQDEWVAETIDLRDFTGADQVTLRFILTSDQYVNRDGFYVDDFRVEAYPQHLPGDVVADGRIDLLDLLTVIDIVEGYDIATAFQLQQADVNTDGTVDINDIMAMVGLIIGNP